MSRTALQVIGQSGLGYDFESLDEQSGNIYAGAVKGVLLVFFVSFPAWYSSFVVSSPTLYHLEVARQCLPLFLSVTTPNFRKFLAGITPWPMFQRLRTMVDVMDETSCEVLESKRAAIRRGDAAVMEQVGRGKDIMSILRTSTTHIMVHYNLL